MNTIPSGYIYTSLEFRNLLVKNKEVIDKGSIHCYDLQGSKLYYVWTDNEEVHRVAMYQKPWMTNNVDNGKDHIEGAALFETNVLDDCVVLYSFDNNMGFLNTNYKYFFNFVVEVLQIELPNAYKHLISTLENKTLMTPMYDMFGVSAFIINNKPYGLYEFVTRQKPFKISVTRIAGGRLDGSVACDYDEHYLYDVEAGTLEKIELKEDEDSEYNTYIVEKVKTSESDSALEK